MILPRVIPCLLLQGKGLVKGVKFKKHTYVGDPINAVHIYNEKEVDEILFLSISATAEGRILSPDYIQSIADQCLVPFGVGGGIQSVDDVGSILSSGAEKVCICTAALSNPELIREASSTFGKQSIVVSIDVKKNLFGSYVVQGRCGSKSFSKDVLEYAAEMELAGAGEILINSIDRDGTGQGYDIKLIQMVAETVSIPVIACGGAGRIEDLEAAVSLGGASAAAAGSLFVFHGRRKAVLINYPSREELVQIRGE